MGAVVSMVSARIAPDRVADLTGRFSEAVRAGLPGHRRQTSLLRGDGGRWRLVTVWGSRDDLERYLASTEEPFALRLFRQAGGAPEVEVLDVVVDSGAPLWP